MRKQEWIGDYWLNVETYHSYKDQWIFEEHNLGKCLGEDEACERAVATLIRDYADSTIREVYIVNGWGNIIYM